MPNIPLPDQEEIEQKNQRRILKDSLCAKCKAAPPSLTSRQNNYCEPCFIQNFDHRFKCHFLKLQIPLNPKVLIAVSGGPASRSLLHLMQSFTKTISPNKPLLFPTAVVCHVDQSSLSGSPHGLVDGVRDMANSYGLPFVSVDMAESAFPDRMLSSYDIDKQDLLNSQSGTLTSSELLRQCLSECGSLSGQEDLLRILTMRTLVEAAKQNECNIIILGDTADLLAVRTISMSSRGRGINLASNVALSSSISFGEGEEITILRPLRESLSKEVGLFNKLKSLNSHSNTDLVVAEAGKKLSIEKMTAIFIEELQADLPSTVSIITKTAFKIQPKKSMVVEQLKNCRLCLGLVDEPTVSGRPILELPQDFCAACRFLISDCRTLPVMRN